MQSATTVAVCLNAQLGAEDIVDIQICTFSISTGLLYSTPSTAMALIKEWKNPVMAAR